MFPGGQRQVALLGFLFLLIPEAEETLPKSFLPSSLSIVDSPLFQKKGRGRGSQELMASFCSP